MSPVIINDSDHTEGPRSVSTAGHRVADPRSAAHQRPARCRIGCCNINGLDEILRKPISMCRLLLMRAAFEIRRTKSSLVVSCVIAV